jgi:ATP-dependent helicase HepA
LHNRKVDDLPERQTKHPFVISSENRLGIGKLKELNGSISQVEYFSSPAEEDLLIVEVPRRSLKQVFLQPETRAYYRNPETLTTEVGRVLAFHKIDQAYFVRFPNNQSRMIPSDDLRVRCRLPISEPIDHLASQLNETAFWHSARAEFVQHLLDQHRKNRGLSALVSSSVELVAHQASVIYRVLLDPFQRYLLADEVGLGKTIEAGVLIKQFTLDVPREHETLVIVPASLCVQWQQELTHRFHLQHLIDASIHVVGNRDEANIAKHIAKAKMVVIDEAHHLCSWAWSTNFEERGIFEVVKHGVESLNRRLLLLSATPVLNNEHSFLAMLHLLDPQVYPLNSLDQFKQRVRMRQEIAECMLSLNENESNFFLSETMEELGDLLAGDAAFQSLRKKLAVLIEADIDEDHPERVILIRAIRTHVSDMWRLHRRILRNRRTNDTEAYLPGRGGLKVVNYDCGCERGLAETVDAWRLHLSVNANSFTADEKSAAQKLARLWDEFAACEPQRIVKFAKQRLEGAEGTEEGDHEEIPLRLLDGEAELIRQVIRAAKACDQDEKLQSLLRLVGREETGESFVIFANFPETADRIFEFLALRLESGRTLRHASNQLGWTQYNSTHRGYILVCDRDAEEGLNLQKRGAIAVHFDLPFSPNRVEQRMGRLDRFGVGMPIQSAALVCGGSSVQKSWCDLLSSSLRVFDSSIASLQYIVDESMQRVWQEYLDAGSDAFVEASRSLGGDEGTIAKERKRIQAQDEIDAFDFDLITQQVADQVEYDDRQVARVAPKVFDNWAVKSLRFRRTGEDNRLDDVFSYEFTRRIDTGRWPRGKDTLMPEDEFVVGFAESIDDVPVERPTEYVTVPMTFDRVVAQRRLTRLLRVGDPFVDALADFTRWDDRGVCYAFWRHLTDYEPIEDPDVFFRFDYVISPNPQPLIELTQRTSGANSNALIRRTQAIMIPRFATIWLDSNLERVMPSDDRYLFLKPAFDKQAKDRDFNLNRERWKEAAKLFDMSLWRDRCLAARRESEAILREHSKLPAWTKDCVAEARERADQVTQQYRSRLAMAKGEISTSLVADLQFEEAFRDAQIESFENPELRVDSVGALFLSRQVPFTEQFEEEGDEF